MIRPMRPEDWPSVREIYQEGIDTGLATFETAVPEWADFDHDHRDDCRLVAVSGDEVVGWIALRPVSARAVYRGVAELNVYVAATHRGRGVGSALMEALLREAAASGIWTLQAAVFPDNLATRRLHARHGFREVGVRERIGRRDGVWRDTLLLELRLPDREP